MSMNLIGSSILSLFKLFFMIFMIMQTGYIYGSVFCFLTFCLHKIIMRKFYNLHSLSANDLCCLANKDGDRFNLNGFMTMENFNPLEMKELIIERLLKNIRKFRMRITCKFFHYYWEEVPLAFAVEQITIHDKLSSEADLNDFMQREVNNHCDLKSKLPYEIHLVPYGEEKKGLFFIKCDHVLSDGLGMVSTICCMSNDYNKDIFPKLMLMNKPPSWYIVLIEYIVFPLYVPLVEVLLLLPLSRTNKIRHRHEVSGESKFAISKPYGLKDFDKLRKNLHLSFNDCVMSLILMGARRINNQSEKVLRVLIPMGRKTVPLSISKVKINNEAEGILMSLPLIDNMKDAKLVSKKIRSYFKFVGLSSVMSKLSYLWTEFIPLEIIQGHAMDFCFRNFDMAVSNVPGPTRELKYGNSRCTGLLPIATPARGLTFMTVMSYNGSFRFALSLDKTNPLDPNQFLNILDEIFIENVMKHKD